MQSNAGAQKLVGALFPGLDKLMPLADEKARQKLDTLQRLKARLTALIEKEHGAAE
jgi:hypothetical protein